MIHFHNGYSKDQRHDCKQFVQEILVSSDGDVPLMFTGNKADVAWITRVPDNILKAKDCLKESNQNYQWIEHACDDGKKIRYQVFNVEKHEINQRFIVVNIDHSEKRS